MNNWKSELPGIVSIEKCVAEFEIFEFKKIPYSKFKVKIFENRIGKFTGNTNIRVKDKDGCPCGGVGYGDTIEEALEEILKFLSELLEEKEVFTKDDFEFTDPYDF